MAPDLNSVPPSPRPPTSSSPRTTFSALPPPAPRSRRASQAMPPPPMPLSSSSLSSGGVNPNVLPSNQGLVGNMLPPVTSPSLSATSISLAAPGGDNTGVGTGPGPLRHPRPLTAADLHLQLEKEQEAVVNRLTRELSLLRAAQNASVASNASTTSTSTTGAGGAGLPDVSHLHSLSYHDSFGSNSNTNHLLSGPNHPIPSQRRHHRSSSSASTRSNTGNSTTWSTLAIAGSEGRPRMPSTSVSQRQDFYTSLSRQNSTASSTYRDPSHFHRDTSGASSPALSSSYHPHPHGDSFFSTSALPHRHREPSFSSMSGGTGTAGVVTSVPTTGRYEELAWQRRELESVKRENDALKRKIVELERTLRGRRASNASELSQAAGRDRGASVSTVGGDEKERDVGGGGVRI